jgi:predicted dehydrogenase
MEKIINWGVIGSGGIARRRTIPEGITRAKNAKLISVFDINQDVNSTVAREFGVIASKSVEDLFNTGIDAVYIATPVNIHSRLAIASAKAGKHVFCEKPLGLTVEEAEKIIKNCEKSGVKLGIGLMMRFIAQHQAALKLINDGKLGNPVYGRAQLSCWYPPITGAFRQDPEKGGGGSLADMGSHCIDLLEMFFGRIKSVSCFINNNIHDYKSEDSALVSLFFENGAMGSVDTFFCIPDNSSKNMLELYGSKGSILAKGTIGQVSAGEMTAYLEDDSMGYNAQQNRNPAEGITINPAPVNPYRAEIEEFSDAIFQKREPVNNASIGLQSQKVMASCYESAKTGKVVNVNSD